MKAISLLVAVLYVSIANTQTCFDIARKGTVEQLNQLYQKDNTVIHSIDQYGSSMLILACYKQNIDVANYLIEKQVDVNYVSDNGTALMAATVKGNIALCEKLLQNGANPDLSDGNGVTALMYAIQFKNIPLIELLLKYNADKKLINREGISTFEYAVNTKNEQIINLIK